MNRNKIEIDAFIQRSIFVLQEKFEYCDVAPCGCIFIIGEGMVVVVHPPQKKTKTIELWPMLGRVCGSFTVTIGSHSNDRATAGIVCGVRIWCQWLPHK